MKRHRKVLRDNIQGIIKGVLNPARVNCDNVVKDSGGADVDVRQEQDHDQREKVGSERRWVLLKRPRCDIDGVGEGK